MTGQRDRSDGESAVPETFDAYAVDRPDARVTDWLRQRAEPDWTAATEGRFVHELGAGTIDDAVFRRYLVQDHAFVGTLAGLIGHAIGDAPTIESKRHLTDFLGTITNEENAFFERSFDALDVPEGDRTDPMSTEPTRAFRDLLGRAAREGGYAESLAVFVPAEWVYLTWARHVADGGLPSKFYLAEWVELHDNSEFESFVGWLRAELDREGVSVSPRRQRRIDRLFRRTVELEAAFFEAAYGERAASTG